VALATPLSVVASTGSAARKGILVKGGLYLEALARVDTVVVDKTGTLTLGKPVVTQISNLNSQFSKDEVLALAATLEQYSEHPLAGAVMAEAKAHGLASDGAHDFEAIPGKGVVARVKGEVACIGTRSLLDERRARERGRCTACGGTGSARPDGAVAGARFDCARSHRRGRCDQT
jgi:Cd2+/Zn2+-exporting ATPase/Cu+-exporting ATPase